MTPLFRLFARVMPRPVALVALALAYAAMIAAILVAGTVESGEMIYTDVRGDRV